MLPYIVAVASALALFASLYKERKLSPSDLGVVRALRLHHAAQLVLVALATWSAIDGENSARETRLARLDAEAALAAARHTTVIHDKFLLEILPAGTALRNFEHYQTAIKATPPEVAARLDWDRVAPQSQKDAVAAAKRAFAELQQVAREVLNESSLYGTRYPEPMTLWAKRTLEITVDSLPALLSDMPEGEAYASLVGSATGFSREKYRDAAAKLEQ